MKLLIPFLLSLLFIACGSDSSTSANDSDDDVSSKSSSSAKAISSSRSVKSSSSTVAKSSSSQKSVSSSSGNASKLVDPADVIVASMTDARDGQTYKTVKIGTQTWMAENLNYETERGSFCYDDNTENCTKFGRLYTWHAAKTGCPDGWHLPTTTECTKLITAAGGERTAGKVLKSASGWYSSGNGTDDFSFSALPAGLRYINDNHNLGRNAHFWSTTESSSYNAYYMYLYDSADEACLSYDNKILGLSVRCLKD